MANFCDKISGKGNHLVLLLVIMVFFTLVHGCSKLKLDVKGDDDEEGKNQIQKMKFKK